MSKGETSSFWFDLLIGPLVAMVHRPAVKLAGPTPRERIIEIGAGTALQLRRYAGEDRFLVGADHDPGMAARGVRNLRGRGAMILADAASLPFPAGSFDLALCSLVIHEMPPAARPILLAEAARVMTDDGRMVIIDFGTGAPTRAAGRFSRKMIRAIERKVGGDHYRNYLDYASRGGLDPLIGVSPFEIAGESEVGDGGIRIVLLKRPGTGRAQ